MFVRDRNGDLLNTNRIITIRIEPTEKEFAVIANYINETNESRKLALYKDKNIDICREYQNKISRKLAVNHEVWEI